MVKLQMLRRSAGGRVDAMFANKRETCASSHDAVTSATNNLFTASAHRRAATGSTYKMQTLYCATCDSAPLNTPRLIGGGWFALCEECLAQNRLEPLSDNVFLPQRFRVLFTMDRPQRLGESSPESLGA